MYFFLMCIHPYLDLYIWLIQHNGLLSLIKIYGLFVNGDG